MGPVILLGAPRSGTTLLAEVLGHHPDVVVLNEPRLVWRKGNDSLSDQLRPHHARPEVVAHIRGHFERARVAAGAERVVEKTPANSVRPGFVDAVFPDARYVHITRDGWGAIPSMRQFWEKRSTGFDRRQRAKLRRRLAEADLAQVRHYAGEVLGRLRPGSRGRPRLYGPRLAGLEEVAVELGVLEAAALQWRTCVDTTRAFGARAGDRYFEVALEELDAPTLAAVVAFCGLAPAHEVTGAFARLYDPVAARRQARLSDAEMAQVAPYLPAATARPCDGGGTGA